MYRSRVTAPVRRARFDFMKPGLFLLDLENTVPDFKAAERIAYARAFGRVGLETMPDELFPAI